MIMMMILTQFHNCSTLKVSESRERERERDIERKKVELNKINVMEPTTDCINSLMKLKLLLYGVLFFLKKN